MVDTIDLANATPEQRTAFQAALTAMGVTAPDPVARTAAINPPATPSEYELSAAEMMSAAKPLIKFVPKALRPALLAGQYGPTAPDFAPYIQKAMEQGRAVDLQGLQVNCRTGIKLSGFQTLIMSGGRLWVFMDDPTEPVFSAKPVAAGQTLNVQFFLRGFGSITGSATVFSFKQPYVVGNGLKVEADNVNFNGLDVLTNVARRAGTRLLDAELIDFVQIKNCNYSNYDQAFRLASPTTSRSNTQIILDGVGGGFVNSVGYISNTALARINVDAASVGGGWVIGPSNGRLVFDRTHVESTAKDATWTNAADESANYARYGWGFYVLDSTENGGSIEFNYGSIFGGIAAVPGSGTPKGGVYIGTNTNGATRNITFRGTLVLPTSPDAPDYIPLEAHQNLRWEGRWIAADQSNIRIGNRGGGDASLTDTFTDVVIDEGQYTRRGTGNLLPGTKAVHLTEKLGSGTIAVSPSDDVYVPDADIVTFTGTGANELYVSLALTEGWYTMLVSGRRRSGSVYAEVRSSSRIPMRKVFNTYSIVYPVTFHMPVYIPVADTYRVGLQGVDNSAAQINDLGFVKGLWPGDIPSGASQAPVALALPSASSRWSGRMLTVSETVYLCVNTSSGYVWKQLS